MLDVVKVRFRNFLSYGDYLTEIDIDSLSICLIIGQIKKNGKIFERKSNGAGKSTIINAILWAVFGRTMHKPSPGDKVINKYIKKNCWVQLVLRNGDVITRTRKFEGESELLVEVAGQTTEKSTISTPREQQLAILRRYGLDWDLFCGSVFMSQYGKSWLSMSDPARKKALERLLRVDRFNYRSDVADEKITACKKESENRGKTAAQHRQTMTTLQAELEETVNANATFEQDRLRRLASAAAEIERLRAEQAAIVVPDIDGLKAKWALVDQIKGIIEGMESKARAFSVVVETQKASIINLDSKIARTRAKANKVCRECAQMVPEGHVHGQVEPDLIERADCVSKQSEAETNRDIMNRRVEETKVMLAQAKPGQTVSEAQLVLRQHNSLADQISRYVAQAESIAQEVNPHGPAIERLQARVDDLRAKAEAFEADQDQFKAAIAHFDYIYRFYHDRKKAKGMVIGRDIPYFNERLGHYLKRVELDLSCQMGMDLAVSFDDTTYDFYSGGERKRADLAFMMATYDLVKRVYGPQCNVLVLDDIDGWVDDDGIGMMIDLVKEELTQKASTIFVVSHTKGMHGVFPNELRVTRDDDNLRMSFLTEVR